MGVLDYLFQLAEMQQENQPRQLAPRDMALPYQNIGPTGGHGPIPFKEPMQAGPSPPVNGPLAAMFEGDQRGKLRSPR